MTTVLLSINEAVTCKELITNIDWQGLDLQLVGCITEEQILAREMESAPFGILITEVSPQIVKVRVLPEVGRQVPERHFANSSDKHKLKQLLKAAIAECEQKKENAFGDESTVKLREKFMRDLLQGNKIDKNNLRRECLGLKMNPNIRYYVIAVEIDNAEEALRNMQEQQKDKLLMQLSTALEGVLRSTDDAFVLSVAEGRYAMLLPDCLTNNVVSLCKNVHKRFCTQTHLSVTCGIGGAPVSVVDLQTAYSKAYETLLYKYMVGNNRVIRYEDIPTTGVGEGHLFNSITIQSQLVQAVRNGDLNTVDRLCEEWFGVLRNSSPIFVKSLLLQLVSGLTVGLLEIGTSLGELFGEEDLLIKKVLKFDTIFDVELWIKQILQYICDYMKSRKQSTTYHIANKAAQYIDEHYAENLNIDMIADEVCLSSGYLMSVFKKEFNISIVSYLTNKRIERAKELLLENEKKIQDIAEEVGYSNATFFSSTFHKKTGQTPRQFREQHLTRKEMNTY